MVNEINSAIITYVDRNNEENFEKDFLESLFGVAQYSGQVIVLDYGLSLETKKRVEATFPIKIVKCKIETDIFVDRYRDIATEIEKLDGNISTIITTDSGDVWFQCSLNQFLDIGDEEIGTVVEKRIWDEDEWALKCINNLSDKDRAMVLQQLKGTYVRNSGVIIGGREIMRTLALKVYQAILRCGYSFFGIDQIFVNYEIRVFSEEKRKILRDVLNYVLISNMNEFYILDEIVYKNNGEKVVVVHNAGGNWRVLKRPFENRWSNPKQYIIENVRKIGKESEV